MIVWSSCCNDADPEITGVNDAANLEFGDVESAILEPLSISISLVDPFLPEPIRADTLLSCVLMNSHSCPISEPRTFSSSNISAAMIKSGVASGVFLMI